MRRFVGTLEFDVVLPVIAKIVLVGKLLERVGFLEQFSQSGLTGVNDLDVIEEHRIAIYLLADLEPVLVGVGSPHGGLNPFVQIIQRAFGD